MQNVLIPKELLKQLDCYVEFEGESLKPYFKVTSIKLKEQRPAPSVPTKRHIDFRDPSGYPEGEPRGRVLGWNELANLINSGQI